MKLIKFFKVLTMSMSLLWATSSWSSVGSSRQHSSSGASPCQNQGFFGMINSGFNYVIKGVSNVVGDDSCKLVENVMSQRKADLRTATEFSAKKSLNAFCKEIMESDDAVSCSREKLTNDDYVDIMSSIDNNQLMKNELINDYQKSMKEIIKLAKIQGSLSFDPAVTIKYADVKESTLTGQMNGCQEIAREKSMNSQKLCGASKNFNHSLFNEIVSSASEQCLNGKADCGFKGGNKRSDPKDTAISVIDLEIAQKEKMVSPLISAPIAADISRALYDRVIYGFFTKSDNINTDKLLANLKMYKDKNDVAGLLDLINDEELDNDPESVKIFLSRLQTFPHLEDASFQDSLFNDEAIQGMFPTAKSAKKKFDEFLKNNPQFVKTGDSFNAVNSFKKNIALDVERRCGEIKTNMSRMLCGGPLTPEAVSEIALKKIIADRRSDNISERTRKARGHCISYRLNHLVNDLQGGKEKVGSFEKSCESILKSAESVLSRQAHDNYTKTINCEIIENEVSEPIKNDPREFNGPPVAVGSKDGNNIKTTLEEKAKMRSPLNTLTRNFLSNVRNQNNKLQGRNKDAKNNTFSPLKSMNKKGFKINSNGVSQSSGLNALFPGGMSLPMSVMNNTDEKAFSNSDDIGESIDRFQEQKGSMSKESQTLLEQLTQMSNRIGNLEGQITQKERELREKTKGSGKSGLQNEIDKLRSELEKAKLLAESNIRKINKNESTQSESRSRPRNFVTRVRSQNKAQSPLSNGVSAVSSLVGAGRAAQRPTSSAAQTSQVSSSVGPVLYAGSPTSSSSGVVDLSRAQVQSYSVVQGYNVSEISRVVSNGVPVIVETEEGRLLCEKNESVRDGIACKKVNLLDQNEAQRALATKSSERKVLKPNRKRSRYEVLEGIIDKGAR